MSFPADEGHGDLQFFPFAHDGKNDPVARLFGLDDAQKIIGAGHLLAVDGDDLVGGVFWSIDSTT